MDNQPADLPMTDGELTDEQVAEIEEQTGANLTGMEAVANDTKAYFAERADEEELDPAEMITAIDAVANQVEDTVLGALSGDLG